MSYVGAAIGGGLAGYAIGQSVYSDAHSTTGNYARGALGGAAGGAALGAQIAGPWGAAIGAVAGFVGGIIGVGKAAKEAEKRMQGLREVLNDNLKLLSAQLSGDTLGAALIQVKQQFDALRKQAEDAYAGRKNEGGRAIALAQIAQLEALRIQQLKDEAALIRARFAEDLRVRLLAAQGRTREADALRLQLAQQREYQEALKNGADPATLALLEQVQAQEKLAAATNRATGAALNMVEGYKLQAAIFGAMSGRAPTGAGASSYSAPSGSRSTVSGSQQPIVIENVTVLNGEVIARSTKKVFQSDAQRRFGDSKRWSET
jgi:hypothetical protein